MTYDDSTTLEAVVGDDHVGTRLYNVLRRVCVKTVGDLKKVTDEDVAKEMNVGPVTLKRLTEVRQKIS
jgi:DNA-directed RNA polymerase alpha subunit